jgi:hypothetical protein
VGLVELAMSRAMDSSIGPGAPASLSGANGYVDCPSLNRVGEWFDQRRLENTLTRRRLATHHDDGESKVFDWICGHDRLSIHACCLGDS